MVVRRILMNSLMEVVLAFENCILCLENPCLLVIVVVGDREIVIINDSKSTIELPERMLILS